MKKRYFTAARTAAYLLALLATMVLCVCAGSVNIPLGETVRVLCGALRGEAQSADPNAVIILTVRLPRVLAVALTGAALSVSGCAMQGMLLNPLADGSTLGVSSGASLGAVLAIALGINVPGLPMAGTMGMAMLFAFGSLAAILMLSYALDAGLSTNTMILVGVIFSMFSSALISLVTAFAGERVKNVTFWTMGSLAGAGYGGAAALTAALAVCGGILLCLAGELNAFAAGEDNARHIGVPVRSVKLTVMICVSALTGVCVSVGGTIGFVGLVTPHMVRMITGPNHRRLLPASMTAGAVFLMLADLAARTLVRPLELPVGVVTSLVGAAAFILIFWRTRKAGGR